MESFSFSSCGAACWRFHSHFSSSTESRDACTHYTESAFTVSQVEDAFSQRTHSHFSTGYTKQTHYFFMLFCALFSPLLLSWRERDSFGSLASMIFARSRVCHTAGMRLFQWHFFLRHRQNAEPFFYAFDEWADALNGERWWRRDTRRFDRVCQSTFENTFAAHFDCLCVRRERDTHLRKRAVELKWMAIWGLWSAAVGSHSHRTLLWSWYMEKVHARFSKCIFGCGRCCHFDPLPNPSKWSALCRIISLFSAGEKFKSLDLNLAYT